MASLTTSTPIPKRRRSLPNAGARVIVPYLRGFGPTRFLKAETPRSGEQAALGADLKALMDALQIERAVLGGYDWGGRAACVVAALRPQRAAALVSGNSYNIQDIARAMEPASAAEEAAFCYNILIIFMDGATLRPTTKPRRWGKQVERSISPRTTCGRIT